MINARLQIEALMKEIIPNVLMGHPEEVVELPLITYGEITNVNVERNHDRISYQIDAYTGTMKECIEKMELIDEKMGALGFYRTYITPDINARQDKDFYHKAANYIADVDTHLNNILQH